MGIKMISETSITVLVERTVTIGQTLKINPSEAWLGIESGNIKIISIGTREQLLEQGNPDVIDSMEAEYEALKDIKHYVEQGQADADDVAFRNSLDTDPWVGYQYQNRAADIYALPLELFLDHTMSY